MPPEPHVRLPFSNDEFPAGALRQFLVVSTAQFWPVHRRYSPCVFGQPVSNPIRNLLLQEQAAGNSGSLFIHPIDKKSLTSEPRSRAQLIDSEEDTFKDHTVDHLIIDQFKPVAFLHCSGL